jgi:hypothetical protein
MKITIDLGEVNSGTLGHIAGVLANAAQVEKGKSAARFVALTRAAAAFDGAEFRQARVECGERERARLAEESSDVIISAYRDGTLERPEFPTYVGSDGQEHGEY